MISKPRIIYVYDALCGWCYGFSPVISQFRRDHADAFTFEVLSGGMMTGARVRPVSESMRYIGEAYKVVEQQTGVQFGDAYLNGLLAEGSYLSDSEPPGVAMTVFKADRPGESVAFAATLQNALYRDGLDLNDPAIYGPLVEPFGLDAAEFVQKLADPVSKQQTLAEFGKVAEWGIGGFPTVIFDPGTGGQLYLLARGYAPLDALNATLDRVLAA
jgi:putative protein-disulfide isomerase